MKNFVNLKRIVYPLDAVPVRETMVRNIQMIVIPNWISIPKLADTAPIK